MTSTIRGQTLVEFALVLPIVLLLIFGVVDVGRAVFAYNTLTNAARQGVRVAAVNQVDPATAPYECDASRPVENPATPHWTFRGCTIAAGGSLPIGPGDIAIQFTPPSGTTLSCSPAVYVGCIVSVTVTYHFNPITPIAGSILGSMTMTSTSSMPVERVFP